MFSYLQTYTVSLSICITFPLALQKSRRIFRNSSKVFTFSAFFLQDGSSNKCTTTSKLATNLLLHTDYDPPFSASPSYDNFDNKAVVPILDLCTRSLTFLHRRSKPRSQKFVSALCHGDVKGSLLKAKRTRFT